MTITEFLTARLDEREARAQRALVDWEDQDWIELDVDPLDHIQANDPHAVLADVAVKRAIVEQASSVEHESDTFDESDTFGNDSSEYRVGFHDGRREVASAMLRHLALPYADHEDYDEAWRS